MLSKINQEILKAIDIVVKKYLKIASFDKTVKGTVISVIDNKHYIVKIEGGNYTLPSLSNETFSIGKSVLVTYFQNNKDNGYVIGKEVR